MTKKGLCIIGDIHTQDNPAKLKQCQSFFKWFLESEYNTEEWDKLFLGDLYEDPEPSNQSTGAVLLFLYSLKGSIHIVTGNHDRNPDTNALDIYRALQSVTVYDRDTEVDLGGLKCLLLPHMDTQSLGLPPMTEYYNTVIPEKYTKDSYDYIFHHLEDDTKHFGEKFVDTSVLKGKVVAGHVHTADIKEGGHYLGSVCKNSKDERNDTKLLGCISYDTKKISYVDIPSFLEFETLEYPNLPESFDKNTLYTILKAPTKRDALDFYTREFANHGQEFHTLKIVSAKDEVLYEEGPTKEVKTEAEYLTLFCSENNIKQSVLSKCLELV